MPSGHFLIRLHPYVFFALVTAWLLTVSDVYAKTMPVCPGAVDDSYPLFGEVGDAPTVAYWRDLAALSDSCQVSISSPAELAIALAGYFSDSGPIDKIALRLGAISETKGLPYWSVSDKEFKTLISDAYAINSDENDAARADFTGQEILSGQTLYVAQNDTSSWGINTYSMRAISSSEKHLVFESRNVSPIKLGPMTLFDSESVQSVLFLNRVDELTWSYFSVTLIKRINVAAPIKSLINRQAALYRFFIGQAPDSHPPLAP